MKDQSTFRSIVTLLAFVTFSVMAIVLFMPIESLCEDEMPVPPKLQAAMFQKIFRFDKTLSGKDVKVLLIHGEEVPDVADILKKEFENVEVSVIIANASELGDKIDEVSVVYVMADVETEPVKKLCTEKSVLSISGLPKLVESGEVSVSIGEQAGKPKIMVNLNQLKAEGHELSAELLKLAKIIK